MPFHALQKCVNWETLVRMFQSVYRSITVKENSNFLPVAAPMFLGALSSKTNTCADVKE